MNLKTAWKRFNEDPFKFAEGVNLKFWRFNLNFFQMSVSNRQTAFFLSILMLGFWIICGWDSTPLQFLYVLVDGVPLLLQGKSVDLRGMYYSLYGKEMHYSAFVIYGLCFWFLSRYLDKHMNIKGARNVVYAVTCVLFSVAAFEWFWMISYYTFQAQPWILTFMFPQARIHIQNFAFTVVGVVGALFIYVDSCVFNKNGDVNGRLFTFRLDKTAVVLVGLTVGSMFLWWFYPLQTQQITVPLNDGDTWTSTPQFPQTLYTVDVNPMDQFNAGEWFYIENNVLHGVNLLVKVLLTLTFTYIFMIKKVKQ